MARQAVESQAYAPEQAHALMAEAVRRLQKIPDSAVAEMVAGDWARVWPGRAANVIFCCR